MHCEIYTKYISNKIKCYLTLNSNADAQVLAAKNSNATYSDALLSPFEVH